MPTLIGDGETVVLPDIYNTTLMTVVVAPWPGAQALVEFTASPAAAVAEGQALWAPWSLGVVSHSTRADLVGNIHDVAYADVFDGPITALRITSAGGSAMYDVREARQ